MAKEDWITRQLEIVKREIDKWPDWKKDGDKVGTRDDKSKPE